MESSGLDPYEDEKRHNKEMKRLKDHQELLEGISAAEYGIPKKISCGGSIVHEASKTPKYKRHFDTLLGSRYFTCHHFKDDGLYFRQPWVYDVEEELGKLMNKIYDQRKAIDDMQAHIKRNSTEIAKLNELV